MVHNGETPETNWLPKGIDGEDLSEWELHEC